MAKRFTDTTKWEDSWFRKLPSKYKAAWEFLRDKVDNAGFWKKDFEVLCFFTRETFTSEDLLHALNDGKDRVKDHGDYWELTDFVSFQYGVLSPDCNPHKHIIELKKKYQKKGYFKGTNTLEDKTRQDKDKIKGDGIKEIEEFRAMSKKIAKAKTL
jgi:hypothetical protein